MIGLFGGTFDPFHIGHLGAAVYLREMCDLEEVWILPAARSPLKGDVAVSANHRRAMIESAIEGIEGLRLDLTDLQRPAPSYSIDMLETVQKEHPDQTFALCMSDDVALSLPQWRNVDRILERAPLIVSRRLLTEIPTTDHAQVDAAIAAGYVNTPIVQIEARLIRERLGQGLTCAHLLPAPVLHYIQKHQLYGRLAPFDDE